MKIGRALKIEGWMKSEELRWLAQQASKCKRIIEIGCYRGRTTRALLDNSTAHIWCIDSWDFRAKGMKKDDKRAFMRNIVADRVTTMQMLSSEAAKLLKGQTFDMIFIDGNHEYEYIRADILAYRSLVRGLLCGHDYHRKSWPGVFKAVNELIPNRQQGPGAIWHCQIT